MTKPKFAHQPAAQPIKGYFSPWSDPRPCWFCHHFDGMAYEGSAARCLRGGFLRISAQAAEGCAFWEREPGADDEPGWVPGAINPPAPPSPPLRARPHA